MAQTRVGANQVGRLWIKLGGNGSSSGGCGSSLVVMDQVRAGADQVWWLWIKFGRVRIKFGGYGSSSGGCGSSLVVIALAEARLHANLRKSEVYFCSG